MAELARTHQSCGLRADTANLRTEEVARADLYQIFQISKVINHACTHDLIVGFAHARSAKLLYTEVFETLHSCIIDTASMRDG